MGSSSHNGLRGKWHGILLRAGVEESALTGKQVPCPICGGKDRFRFDDKGEGMWFCNQCGPGDGFGLLCQMLRIDFKEALSKAREMAGYVEEKPVRVADDKTKLDRMRRAWSEASCLAPGLVEYLTGRGIPMHLINDPVLRWHPGLSSMTGTGPAMLARYFNWDGNRMQSCTIQRVWPSFKDKMVMPSPVKMNGVVCPLGGKPKEILGIGEGVETALSYRTLCELDNNGSFPVWAAYSADQLRLFTPPEYVKQLHILVDIDYSFTGQAACYEMARRLRVRRNDLRIVIETPENPCERPNWDFNDELMRRLA